MSVVPKVETLLVRCSALELQHVSYIITSTTAARLAVMSQDPTDVVLTCAPSGRSPLRALYYKNVIIGTTCKTGGSFRLPLLILTELNRGFMIIMELDGWLAYEFRCSFAISFSITYSVALKTS